MPAPYPVDARDRVNSRRRWLASGVAVPTLGWIGTLHAQDKPPLVIGWLTPNGRREGRAAQAIHEGMAALGWKAATQYVLEERYADGRADRLPALAQEIAARKPAVIVAFTSTAARAAAAAAPTTPIVLAAGDPMSTGLVSNLARPGGMITGLSNVSSDLNLKVVELLVESVPRLRRIGFLADSTSSRHAATVTSARRAAEHFRVQALIGEVARPEDIEPAVARLAAEKAQALVVLTGVWLGEFHGKVIALAQAQRWPIAGTISAIPRQGGLLGFGPDALALIRRSTTYVDRILKGARPGDLPIEQPTTFELVLNLKAARQLGLSIPRTVVARATEVIE